MKSTFSIFVVILLCALFTTDMVAQQTWQWDAYKVKVDLPDDFKVTKNNDNEFEATGEGMELLMYIFEADITLDEMKQATIDAAKDMELEEWDSVENITTRGFEGKYVAGYAEGSAVLLSGLINPKNITNFFVVVLFNDDDDVAEEAAFDILDSIRK